MPATGRSYVFDLGTKRIEVVVGESLVDDEQDLRDLELARHVDRHRRPLEVLLIGAQHQHQHVEIVIESSVSSLSPGWVSISR